MIASVSVATSAMLGVMTRAGADRRQTKRATSESASAPAQPTLPIIIATFFSAPPESIVGIAMLRRTTGVTRTTSTASVQSGPAAREGDGAGAWSWVMRSSRQLTDSLRACKVEVHLPILPVESVSRNLPVSEPMGCETIPFEDSLGSEPSCPCSRHTACGGHSRGVNARPMRRKLDRRVPPGVLSLVVLGICFAFE